MNLVIIFPNQLFPITYYTKIVEETDHIVIIEDDHFFTKYNFHKLKIAYHRATMKNYFSLLHKKFKNISYIENSDSNFKKIVKSYDPTNIKLYNPIEKELLENINALPKKYNIILYDSPYFLNSEADNSEINKQLNSVRHDSFYKIQRVKYELLLQNGKPLFNKWSFDTENRSKFPKDQEEVKVPKITQNKFIKEAINYVTKNFNNNYGELEEIMYPITRKDSLTWLNAFIKYKLANFGKYEDAINDNITFGFHSVLSPMLNIGLITPLDVIDKIKEINITKNNISTIEGFIRQIIGWREYSYFIYLIYGSYLEKHFYYKNNKNKIPNSFWNGETQIPYIDTIIHKVNKYAYCHHIERLMCISNFLNLINVHPQQIYNWFMCMFIDAYDVFMIPNVYGMALYGFVNNKEHQMTKPYLCSSNYILKMSNYKNGEWTDIIDALYYEYIKKNQTMFAKIYSLAPAVQRYNKFTTSKKQEYSKIKKTFIKQLYI